MTLPLVVIVAWIGAIGLNVVSWIAVVVLVRKIARMKAIAYELKQVSTRLIE